MTPGFIAAVAALCLAVGGGTFFLAGSGVTMEQLTKYRGAAQLVSSVDSTCKEMWVPGARNGPALLCYLTSNPSRLCAKSERRHLAMVMREYRMDEAMKRNALTLAGFKAVSIGQGAMTNGNIGVMTASIEDSGKKSPRYTQAQANKAFEEHGKLIKKMEDSVNTPELNRIMSVQSVPEVKIIAAIRRLGEAGFVAKGDFGWFSDDFVKAAFNGLTVKNAPCRG